MDFPGDMVSSLIIVTLPFSVPDQIRRQEQLKYQTLTDYILSSVVPDMQQKLRQGFGRAIRTETDTCVISILDARGIKGGRYHHHVLDALPAMPVTNRTVIVSEFIRAVKNQAYFSLTLGF
jgi:ATP-dependent DNA helicase DinG